MVVLARHKKRERRNVSHPPSSTSITITIKCPGQRLFSNVGVLIFLIHVIMKLEHVLTTKKMGQRAQECQEPDRCQLQGQGSDRQKSPSHVLAMPWKDPDGNASLQS